MEIYGEVKRGKVYCLKLEKDKSGILLRIVDEEGNPVNCGKILEIQEDGTLYLFNSISSEVPVKTDLNGRIIISTTWSGSTAWCGIARVK